MNTITIDFDTFSVTCPASLRGLMCRIYDAADDGGILQASDMLALGCFGAEQHTTCSMQQAMVWAGAELVD